MECGVCPFISAIYGRESPTRSLPRKSVATTKVATIRVVSFLLSFYSFPSILLACSRNLKIELMATEDTSQAIECILDDEDLARI